jgi:hypothetical protein
MDKISIKYVIRIIKTNKTKNLIFKAKVSSLISFKYHVLFLTKSN